MQRSVRDFFAKKPNANQNKSNQKNKSNVQERFDALTSRDREALRNVCHMTAVFKMAAAQMKFPPETYDELLSICDIDQKEDTQEPLSLAEANIDHIIECNKKPRILHPSLKWPKNKKTMQVAQEKEKENNANENKMNEVIEPAKKKRKYGADKAEVDE
eukprot:1034389_1